MRRLSATRTLLTFVPAALLALTGDARPQIVFEPPTSKTLAYMTQGVISADMNLDGHADLVSLPYANPSVSSATGFSVLFGNGDGTFGATVATSTGLAFSGPGTAGLLNGDAIPDLALAGHFAAVSLYFGSGDGTFPIHQTIGLPAANVISEVTAIDLTGDGLLDLVAIDQGEFQFP